MSKAQIWALIVFGTLLLLIGSFVSDILFYLGLILIGAGLYLGLRLGGILRKEQVLDSWGMLIENGQGKFNEIFKDTEDFIKESKAPSLGIRKEKMSPGIIGSFFSAKRDFLMVKDQQSSMLSPYQIFINARDYGNNLDVSWYLTYRPSLFEALLLLFRPGASSIALSELDLFELQDLTAYTTVCHHSTLKSVGKLMLALDQDPSKIERKSKGFLGIS
ncbi:hypothetical protein ANME2D_03414 [Candidatus Methanoperedens nitroreducens]|uniref:Uncharacterized protein n=1 Tax=Candidatus Methanoperedens nitratireducens TaxID=1392998 RepID=A0A062V0Y0_9EURY|nr:hypothetical protein [Candidatus Methanoperedens nitroreducens]KCZ70298.1 hypothetical protein ANME2D_03414 [Candidatus Methanoperedens nitroreducens]MDJ1421336.1 hypothetical protein [Candidatus Methanoperedens sp.]